jgi:hypothetical protein
MPAHILQVLPLGLFYYQVDIADLIVQLLDIILLHLDLLREVQLAGIPIRLVTHPEPSKPDRFVSGLG